MRRTAWIIGTAMLAVGLVGCGGAPAPGTTKAAPSVDSSEGATYSAAKEAFLAYVSAGNNVNYSDPATFDAIEATTIGDQQERERIAFDSFHADRWSLSGATRVSELRDSDKPNTHLEAYIDACLDTSALKYRDETGAVRTPPRESNLYNLTVKLTRADSDSPLRVETLEVKGAGFICE